jgi:outer membrane protein TolC
MRLPVCVVEEYVSMHRYIRSGARLALVAAAMLFVSVSAFGQSAQAPPAPAQPPAQPPAATQPQAPAPAPVPQQPPEAMPVTQPHAVAGPGQILRALSVEEAVKLALEQNLGVQVERLNPALADLAISQAKTAWTPTLSGGFIGRMQDSPPNSFLSGAQDKIENRSVGGNAQFSQLLPFGTQYMVGYDSARLTTNNAFSSFNPEVDANFDFTVIQPFLRNFKIDTQRLQYMLAKKDKEITDVGLNQTIALTIRQVKNAYWEYKYALASLDVARQSLALAQQSLRDTRARVEIGTLAPIDVVQAESEVAAREEGVILAEALIGQTEDRLRSIILDPSTPQFWNLKLDPADPVPFQVQKIDVNAAVMRALRERTDLVQTRKELERTGMNEAFFKNQTLPDLNFRVDYNSTGLAGTQLIREGDTFPPPVTGTVNKGYGALLKDVFGSAFPTWVFQVNVSYPIGTSSAEVALTSTRLQQRQQMIGLRNQELQATTEVRDAARQLDANNQRVAATRSARVLAERRLDAEEKKFAAGMSTSFLVIQAQRDLAQARINELRAVLDYVNSQTDYETVQVAPVSGTANFNVGSSALSGQSPVTGSNAPAAGGAGAGGTAAGAGGVQ